MPFKKLQEIIIDYAQHLYTEGRFRALDSSIEYPYDGPAFAFRRDGDRLQLIDNTQELFRLPDGKEILAPVNHRDFREPLRPDQWEQLSDRAVLRFSRFPSIADLHDIACELQHLAQIKANSEWLTKMRADWSRSQTDDGATGSGGSGLRVLL